MNKHEMALYGQLRTLHHTLLDSLAFMETDETRGSRWDMSGPFAHVHSALMHVFVLSEHLLNVRRVPTREFLNRLGQLCDWGHLEVGVKEVYTSVLQGRQATEHAPSP